MTLFHVTAPFHFHGTSQWGGELPGTAHHVINNNATHRHYLILDSWSPHKRGSTVPLL